MMGEVVGLLAKDETTDMRAELRSPVMKARPGVSDTNEDLKRFFLDTARDNPPVVPCMSPVNVRSGSWTRRTPRSSRSSRRTSTR
jgi:hypothetical protein